MILENTIGTDLTSVEGKLDTLDGKINTVDGVVDTISTNVNTVDGIVDTINGNTETTSSVIKSVQRGSYNAPAADSEHAVEDVTITSVDVDKSMIITVGSSTQYNFPVACSGKLTSATNLQCSSSDNYNDSTYHKVVWQVIEYY